MIDRFVEFSITVDILLLNNTNLKAITYLKSVNMLFQFYQLQNNILMHTRWSFTFFPSRPPATGKSYLKWSQIISIKLILKITIKFTISPSCLIWIVSCKLLRSCFVFPRFGFITQGLSVQKDLCFLEGQLIWLLHCVTLS